MKRLVPALSVLWTALQLAVPAFAADTSGYETLDLSTRDTISGKMLVIAAYAVIFTFLTLYTGSIVRREQKVRKSIEALKRSILAKK